MREKMGRQNFKVKCANCEKPFMYYSSEFRPFCSERCKMIDLGHWMSESYTVPSKEPLSESEVELVLKAQSEKDEYEH